VQIQGMFKTRGSSMETLKEGILKMIQVDVPEVKEIREFTSDSDTVSEKECAKMDEKLQEKNPKV
jgi:Fe-S cluster biogenesis protein NfuA